MKRSRSLRFLFFLSLFSLNHTTIEAASFSPLKALLTLGLTFCRFSQPVESLEGSSYNVTGTDQYECAKRVDVTPNDGFIMTGPTFNSSLNETRANQGRLISFHADTSVDLSILFDDIDVKRGPFLKTTDENHYLAFNRLNDTSTIVVVKGNVNDISDIERSVAILEDKDLHLRSISVDKQRDLLALVGHRENGPQDNDMRIFVLNSTLGPQYDFVLHGNVTMAPTKSPTKGPTTSPIHPPSQMPSMAPTLPTTSHPTASPHNNPTSSPTHPPSHMPSGSPSKHPTKTPSVSPTHSPTIPPAGNPDAYATCSHYTREGHLIIGGHSSLKGGFDIWLLRLNGTVFVNGREVSSIYNEHGMAIIELHKSDDVYFVGGTYIDGKFKLLIQRLTYWFDEIWSIILEGVSPIEEGLDIDEDDNIYVSADAHIQDSTSPDTIHVKIFPNGKRDYARYYGSGGVGKGYHGKVRANSHFISVGCRIMQGRDHDIGFYNIPLDGQTTCGLTTTINITNYTGQLTFTPIHPIVSLINDHIVTPAPFSFAPDPLNEQNLCEGAPNIPVSPPTPRPTKAPTNSDDENFFEKNMEIILAIGIPVVVIIICLALACSGILGPCWETLCHQGFCNEFCNNHCRNACCDAIRGVEKVEITKEVVKTGVQDVNEKGMRRLLNFSPNKSIEMVHDIQLETANLTGY
ncbi:MAG: hypothetical protein AAF335_01745 [Bacteroidota bacterium]